GESILARVIVNAQHERPSDRFNVVAWQAAFVSNTAIKLDRADKLFEGRCLKNYPPFAIGDKARAVKNYSIIATHQINEHDRNSGQPGAMRNHRAALGHLPFVK